MTPYEAKLEQRLTALGFDGDRLSLLPDNGFHLIMSREQEWGRLWFAVAPMDLRPPQAQARLAETLGEALRARSEAAAEGGRLYAILVFPFRDGRADEVADQLRSLRREEPEGRWGVIPWTADLKVELIDRHTGFPPVDVAVVRAVAEGPPGPAPAVLQPNRHREVQYGRERWLGSTETTVTRFILAFTVAYYLWVALLGGRGLLSAPPLETLMAWGANHGRNVLLRGEHWRLLTHLFLHGSLIHLGFNMWALWNVGRYVEILFGSVSMTYIYVVAGITGGLASTVLRPSFVPSVGGSGAILGLMGALLYFALARRSRVDWRPIAGPVLINLFIGFAWVGIDNYAHVGGVIGGFLAAFISGLPGQRGGWRRVAMGLSSALLAFAVSSLIPLPHLPLGW